MDASVENEIKDKCKNSIQLVLSKCDDFTTLENLLSSSTSADIISCILDKISKVFNFNWFSLLYTNILINARF